MTDAVKSWVLEYRNPVGDGERHWLSAFGSASWPTYACSFTEAIGLLNRQATFPGTDFRQWRIRNTVSNTTVRVCPVLDGGFLVYHG